MTAAVRARSQEAVDALTEADDHLAFARTVLARGMVGSARRAEYDARIDTVGARLVDPCQYLAVIGEFSSGKTSFVNALLGDALLSARPWPTTAAVTHLRAGSRLRLCCRFRDDPREYTFPGDDGDDGDGGNGGDALITEVRRRLGRAAGPGAPADVPGMLALLTAEEQVAPHVRAVTVTHPARALSDGLVVIDTPGTNASAGHTEITRRVVQDEADAAVVVMAADDPLPESLAAFLRAALDPHLLRRCVFLVTKMATVEESEQDDLLRTIGSRVRSMLGIEDAVVLPVSVGVVVRNIEGRPPSAVEQPWVERFEATRTEVLSILDRRRAVAVSDRILTLLDDLLGTLREDLAAERSAVRREQQELAASGLADLDRFTTARRSHATTRIARSVRVTRTEVERHVDVVGRALLDTAVAATTGDSVGRKKRIDDAVAYQVRDLQERCQGELRTLGRAAGMSVGELDVAFADAYRRLGRLAPEATSVPVSSTLDVAAIGAAALTGVTELSARHDSTENMLMGTGAAAGALVGTMILPGVGTVLGAMLGSGTFLFGSGQRERAMCEQVRTSTATLVVRLREEVLGHVDRVGAQCATAVDRRIEVLRRHYDPLVRDARARHESRSRALRDRERSLDSVLEELARRDDRLEARRRRLSRAGDGRDG